MGAQGLLSKANPHFLWCSHSLLGSYESMVFVSNPPINSFRTKRYAPIAPGPHTSHRTSGGVLTGLFGKKKKIQKGCWCSGAHRRRRPPHENIFLWTQTPPRSVIQVTSAKLMRGRMSKPPATW